MANPNSTFDQTLSAATYKYLKEGEFLDNIFTGSHLLSLYKKYGAYKTVDGGHSLIVPLEYATNPTVGSSTPWQETEFQETDEFTSAQYTWKQIDGSIALSKMDIAQNSGEAQIVNLMKAKLSNLERSIKQNFNQQMYNGNGTVATNINGIVDLVSSSGTIGGIASTSANSWWRSSILSSGVALDEVMMETQYNNAFYDEPIQVIVTTQALFEKYNDLARTSIQTNKPDARIAEMGFDNATFKGKPIIWDRDCIAGHMYFLNFKYLTLQAHNLFNFEVSSPIELQKQHVIAHKCLWIGNHVISNRRMCSRGQLWTA